MTAITLIYVETATSTRRIFPNFKNFEFKFLFPKKSNQLGIIVQTRGGNKSYFSFPWMLSD